MSRPSSKLAVPVTAPETSSVEQPPIESNYTPTAIPSNFSLYHHGGSTTNSTAAATTSPSSSPLNPSASNPAEKPQKDRKR